jgi:signal transduction histidine kinase
MPQVSSSASISTTRWLVGVTTSVVVSFALATAVTEHYEAEVADHAQDIIGNAMPSVQMLSSARSNLRVLENDLEQYAASTGRLRDELRENLTAVRQSFEQSLATYASLPFFPTERELYLHVDEDRVLLDRSIDGLLANPSSDELSRLHHQIDLVDGAIQRVVAFDAAQGQQLGLKIRAVHARAAVLIAFLDGVCVVLAAIATVLALRQVRRAARASQAERTASEARESALAEQNEALGHFAGRVAHDVLSPLSTAQLSFDFLRGAAGGDDSTRRILDRGDAAVRQVQTLVNDLLAFSRAGGHPEPGATTEVAPVIADVVTELGAQAKQHDIALGISAIPSGTVGCSPGVLTSIVSNLVRNAIKYMSDSVTRRIEIRVETHGERWRFEVEDTGPGIPVEQQQRIFEPYVRLARGGTGIGLGLATVERLVHAHGGSVGVSSPPEAGAVFWFELPAG